MSVLGTVMSTWLNDPIAGRGATNAVRLAARPGTLLPPGPRRPVRLVTLHIPQVSSKASRLGLGLAQTYVARQTQT